MTEKCPSAHVQHCTRNSEPSDFVKVSARSTGNFSDDFEAEGALVCSIRGPPGRNPRWQSRHTAAAKFTFQDEMVVGVWREMLGVWLGSLWFGGIVCLRRGREVGSARTRR